VNLAEVVMGTRHTAFPLRTSEAVVAALSDWLTFALTVGSSSEQYWAINLTGAGLAFVTCWLIEGEDGGGFTRLRFARALGAAAIVAVPLPVLGTLTAAAALSWSRLQGARRRRAH
jgi:hypothetical protein